MPPQQFQRLLDFGGDGGDLGAHWGSSSSAHSTVSFDSRKAHAFARAASTQPGRLSLSQAFHP
jgi:hypothetical protein